jgi:hypothetical protein
VRQASKECGPEGCVNTRPALTTNTPSVSEGTSMADGQSTVTYKDVPGSPGYRVGDDGTVWRYCPGSRSQPKRRPPRWKQVGHPVRFGYQRVVLAPKGCPRVCRFTHRLVLEVFVGPCPPGMEACHNDGDPANNALTNLRWDTHQSNIDDSESHGTRRRGERIPWAKLTEADVRQIRRLHANGSGYKSLGKMFGVTDLNIRAIVKGRSWASVV